MKKNVLLKTLLFILGLIVFGHVNAITFNGVSDSTAILDEPIVSSLDYDLSIGESVISFGVYESPDGLSIDNSGNITFTPDNIADGGRVYIQAATTLGTFYYHFNMYVSDEVACDADIAAYYKFDDGAGTTFADQAGGPNAVSGTSLTSVSGQVGNAVNMPTSTQNANYIQIADANQFEWNANQGFSFAAWVYMYGKTAWQLAGNASDQILFHRSDGTNNNLIAIGFDGQNTGTTNLYPKFRVKASGQSVETYVPDTAMTFNSWQHIVFVYDPITNPSTGIVKQKIYLNGEGIGAPETYIDEGANFYSDGTAMDLGYYSPLGDLPFNGRMDELMIFNKVLTSGEVSTLYADGVLGNEQCAPGNHAPELINNFPRDVDQGDPYSVTLVAEDIDGDLSLTVGSVSLPDWMELVGNELRSKTNRPNQGDVGDHTFTLSVGDGTVTVNRLFHVKVWDTPEITSSAAPSTATEEVEYTHTFTWDGEDAGETFSVTYSDEIDWLTFDEGTGVLSGTPDDDDLTNPASGNQVFTATLTVSDGKTSADEDIEITVTAVNDAPIVSGQNVIETDEATPILLTPELVFTLGVNIMDPDNELSDYTITSVDDGANYSVAGTLVTPDDHYSGIINVPIEFTDGDNTDSRTLIIGVAFVNDEPQVTSDSTASGDDYEAFEYTLTATDSDPGTTLVFDEVAIPSWSTFDAATGVLSGTPAYNNIGDTVAVLSIFDGFVTIDFELDISIGNDNDGPEIEAVGEQIWVPGELVNVTITATDVDEDDVLTFEIQPGIPNGLNFDINQANRTAQLHGIPVFNASNDPFAVIVTVSDGEEDAYITFSIRPSAIGEQLESSIMIYPIPTSNVLTIEHRDIAGSALFEVLSVNGKTMLQEQLNGNGKTTFDVSGFETGMYIYRIIENESLVTGKILIN